MTLLHLHIPGDAPNIEGLLERLSEDPGVDAIWRDGDSYREWGERRRDDDPEHIVIVADYDAADHLCWLLARDGVLVDCTLAEDWSANVTWGLGDPPKGWLDRYPVRPSEEV